jgi:membrane-anchored protein YejM (alkaline phosphatase superfamily)
LSWSPDDPIPQIQASQTMAEVIHELGFFTVAFSTHGWGRGQFGFNRGFQQYYEGACWLDQLPQTKEGLMNCEHNYFAWVHLLNLHDWYKNGDLDIVEWRNLIKEDKITEELIRRARKEYQIGVDKMDQSLMEFLVGFEPDDNTIIILTSDHGEALFEYNNKAFQHGQCYTNEVKELMDIPFIMSGMKFGGVKVGYRTYDVDVMPSMIELAAALTETKESIPLPGIEGRSMFNHNNRAMVSESSMPADDIVVVSDAEKEAIIKELEGLGYMQKG